MPMIGMNGNRLFDEEDHIDSLIERQQEIIREMSDIIYENAVLKVNLKLANFIPTLKNNKELKERYKALESELELVIECLQDYGY